MKRLLIILAILIMLTGGAVSAMRFLQLGPFAPGNDPATAADQPDHGEAPLFVEMDPLYVPMLAGDRVVATVQLQVRIETRVAESEALIRKKLPRLSDAYLRDLYSFLPRLVHRGHTIDAAVIRERLEFITSRVLGPGIADAVLIQSLTDASATPPGPAPANPSALQP